MNIYFCFYAELFVSLFSLAKNHLGLTYCIRTAQKVVKVLLFWPQIRVFLDLFEDEFPDICEFVNMGSQSVLQNFSGIFQYDRRLACEDDIHDTLQYGKRSILVLNIGSSSISLHYEIRHHKELHMFSTFLHQSIPKGTVILNAGYRGGRNFYTNSKIVLPHSRS